MSGLKFTKTHYGALIAGAITLLWVGFFYHDVLLHPASYLFNLHGDGLANYFTFAWHIRYDNAMAAFGGMHYPYGEHLPYVDCHPLLSSFLQITRLFGIDGGIWPIGFLNLLMLLAPVASAVFLYLVMIRFQVATWGAAVSAPAIALLSSQALLMGFGHYALTYSLFFPLGWYLLLKSAEQPQRIGHAFAVMINILVWTYTHNYLGAILLMFTAVVHLQTVVRKTAWEGEERRASFLRLSQIVIPALVIYCITILSDPHAGRIEMPFDPAHTASFYTVLIPNYALTRPLFETVLDLGPQVQQSWGRVGNYIGIPSLIALLVLAVMYVMWLLGRRADLKFLRPLMPYLLSSLVLLAFAMGGHFKITGPGWLEYVSPVKQFVGLGRFAWAFYYVICVTTIILILQIRGRVLRPIVLILAVLVYFLEGIGYHQRLSENITRAANALDINLPEHEHLKELTKAFDTDLYQAIIPLPFYHKYVTPGTFGETDLSIMTSMQCAYFTGLPLVSAILSRPSVREGRNIIRLFAPNQYEKPIRDALPDERPFLVLYTGEPLHPLEQAIWEETENIKEAGGLSFGAIAHQSLFRYDHEHEGLVFLSEYEELFEHLSGWRLADSSAHVEFLGFDDKPSDHVYRGRGAWSGDIAVQHELFRSASLQPGVGYELSFWYYNHLYDQVYNRMWVEERDSRNTVVKSWEIAPTSHPLSDGDWVWNVLDCTVSQDGNRIALMSKGEARYEKAFYVDEILLREASSDVLKLIPGQGEVLCIRNNQLVARIGR